MKNLKASFTIALLACFLTVKTTAQVGLTTNSVKKSIMIAPQNHSVKLNPYKLNLPKVYLYKLANSGNNTFLNTRIESNFNRKFTPWERFLSDPPFSFDLMSFY